MSKWWKVHYLLTNPYLFFSFFFFFFFNFNFYNFLMSQTKMPLVFSLALVTKLTSKGVDAWRWRRILLRFSVGLWGWWFVWNFLIGFLLSLGVWLFCLDYGLNDWEIGRDVYGSYGWATWCQWLGADLRACEIRYGHLSFLLRGGDCWMGLGSYGKFVVDITHLFHDSAYLI